MKSFVKVLCVVVVLFAPQLVIADSALSKDAHITVTISPAVQEQIQKASSDERKKMEAAINVGNKFIPHHFDLTAYARNDEQELKLWLKNIRPLVNRDDADWYTPGGVFADSAPELEINGKKVTFEVVCPRPELISVSAVNEHFQLKYRSKIIGMWRTNSMLFTEGDIILDGKEKFDEVLISLDKSNRVSQVASKYAVLPSIPKQGINHFKGYIKRPWRVLIDSPSGVIMETQSNVNANVIKYKQFIELIKNEEAVACKGASANYK